MFDYVALVWNPARADEAHAAHELTSRLRAAKSGWTCVLEQTGTCVFVTHTGTGSSRAYQLQNGAGVVLGTIFKRRRELGHPDVQASFDVEETHRVLSSQGRDLLSNYWGRYVAIICDAERGATFVLRSPSGEVDCLTTEHRRVRLYFSSMRACVELGLSDHSINWRYVAAFLCAPVYESRQTGLRSVERVVHGECVRIAASHTSSSWYWHPCDFVRDRMAENDAEAAQALRGVTRTCIHSWASCYERTVVLLSGGLDSSIVTALLADAPNQPQLTCLNYRNPFDLSTDERQFARLAAQRAQAQLIEHEQQVVFDLCERLVMPISESPFTNFYLFAPDHSAARAARDARASVLVSGEGGDQIFYQNGAAYACRDYWQDHGMSRALLMFALDAARMEGVTVWDVLFSARFRSAAGQLLESISRQALVKAPVRESVISDGLFLHPWFARGAELSPAKWWHLFCITTAMDRDLYDPTGSATTPENLTLLVSQPLLELCLRIPCYVLLSGGRDRGLARRAFRPDLPPEICMRRSKASTYDSAKALLANNIALANEMLMDGMLVREGMLDRAALQATLRGVSKVEGHAGQVLIYLLCEAWLSQWTSSRTRVAA